MNEESIKSIDVDLDAKTITIAPVFDAPSERFWRIITDPAPVPYWFGLRALNTLPGGKTRLSIQSHYNSIQALESSLEGGAESGVNEMYDRLAELLA